MSSVDYLKIYEHFSEDKMRVFIIGGSGDEFDPNDPDCLIVVAASPERAIELAVADGANAVNGEISWVEIIEEEIIARGSSPSYLDE
jgi:hypothetical protein